MNTMSTFEKAKMLFNQYLAFFSVLAFKTITIREDRGVCTAAINDRDELVWNPDFFGGNHKSLAFALAHEVCHKFLRHHQRMADKIVDKKFQEREHKTINIAMDCVVNKMLNQSIKDNGAGNFFDSSEFMTFASLSKQLGVTIPAHIEEGSWEVVYDWLKKQIKDSQEDSTGEGEGEGEGEDEGKGKGKEGGKNGKKSSRGSRMVDKYNPDVDPIKNDPEKEQRMREAEVSAANIASKLAGKLPGAVAKILEKHKEEEVDYVTKLLQYFTARDRQYDNWLKPNRRYLSTVGLMPTKDGKRAGVVVVAVDTSGSVDDKMVGRFLGQVESICDQCKPEELHVIQCDSTIQDVIIRGEGDYFLGRVEVKGRGGTNFKPVMDYIRNMDRQPDALVYLTDMYGYFGDDPQVPVLWCDFDGSYNGPVPFGERIVVRGKV